MSFSSSRFSLSIGALLLLLSLSDAVSATELTEQREFDYFLLALQWSGTICRRSHHCCSTNACCRGENSPTGFTIHGLWSDYNDGTWPACCKDTAFDLNKVSTLISDMEKYWPSLSCGGVSTCHGGKGLFWAHEWEKHGTCSSAVTGDEYNYFLTTLNLYFKYNVTRILNEAGYVASNTEKYPLGGIITEIQNAFHATPLIICSSGAVEELRLCFYKDFKPMDCIKSKDINKKNTCPKYVSLPASVSLGMGNGEASLPWSEEAESF